MISESKFSEIASKIKPMNLDEIFELAAPAPVQIGPLSFSLSNGSFLHGFLLRSARDRRGDLWNLVIRGMTDRAAPGDGISFVSSAHVLSITALSIETVASQLGLEQLDSSDLAPAPSKLEMKRLAKEMGDQLNSNFKQIFTVVIDSSSIDSASEDDLKAFKYMLQIVPDTFSTFISDAMAKSVIKEKFNSVHLAIAPTWNVQLKQNTLLITASGSNKNGKFNKQSLLNLIDKIL